MEEHNIFQDPVNNIIGVVTPQVRNEIFGFANIFSALLAVTDQELDFSVN